jgi:outer membrane protein insertion porin family
MVRKITISVLSLLAVAQIYMHSEDRIFNNPKIKDIQFTGLINTHPEEAKQWIAFKIGDNLSERNINESLKKLFSLDIFKDAKVQLTEDTNGLIVTFVVVENAYIRHIEYHGNINIRKEDLDKEIEFTENSYFTKAKLNKSINAITKKYIEDGFIDISVSYSLKVVDVVKNIYDLSFKINEGKKVVVERVDINGSKEVPVGDIKGIMKTKESFWIFVPGVLKEEEFREDKQKIMDLYNQRGFMDVDIKSFEWKIDTLGQDKHKAIVVSIELVEGSKYLTGKTTMKGNSIFSTEELSGLLTSKEGDTYDRIRMDMIRMAIYNKYSDNGHLYANVSLVMNKNITNRVIDSEFVITEGPKAHIEKATVSGNTKTQAYVIEREFLFKEGELYVQRKVRQTYETLMQLQYFSDVKFTPYPGSSEGLINLDVEVEEQRTGIFTVSLGYGTESGFNVGASVSEKNLFGTGKVVSLKGEWGQKRQLIEVSFQEPWLQWFKERTSAGISLSYARYLYDNIPADNNGDGIIDGTDLNYINTPSQTLSTYTSTNSYTHEVIGLGLNLGRRLAVYWSGSLGFGMSIFRDSLANFNNPLYYSTTWQTNTALIDSLNKPNFTFKNNLSLGINQNSTDNPLNATYGSVFSFDLVYFGGIVGGDSQFIRPHLSFDYYWNPIWKIVLAFHGSADVMLPQLDGKFAYDSSDLLYFDGMYEMRGWQSYPIRGQIKNFYSSELRFQIYQEIWGAFFYDMGNLWTTYKGWTPFGGDGYIYSFGLGIKINIPMIPIRFYLAKRGYYDSPTRQWLFTGKQEFFSDWQPVLTIQGLF